MWYAWHWTWASAEAKKMRTGAAARKNLSHGGSKIRFLNGGEGFFKIDATERAIFATIGVWWRNLGSVFPLSNSFGFQGSFSLTSQDHETCCMYWPPLAVDMFMLVGALMVLCSWGGFWNYTVSWTESPPISTIFFQPSITPAVKESEGFIKTKFRVRVCIYLEIHTVDSWSIRA